jgi:hypothetical protein
MAANLLKHEVGNAGIGWIQLLFSGFGHRPTFTRWERLLFSRQPVQDGGGLEPNAEEVHFARSHNGHRSRAKHGSAGSGNQKQGSNPAASLRLGRRRVQSKPRGIGEGWMPLQLLRISQEFFFRKDSQ